MSSAPSLATLMSMLALLPICAAMLRSASLPIVTLAPAVSRPALLPRGVLTAGTAQVRVRPAVRMFAEPPPEEPDEDDDMFEDLLNELTTAQKIMKVLPPGTAKTGAVALPLVISLLGWVFAPAAAGRFSTLFGLAGGTIGYKAGD